MPFLAIWLGALFVQFAVWLAQWMTKKVAFAVAAIATFSLLTLGLVAAMQALIAGMILVFPESHPMVLTIMWVGIPDNATLCLGAVIAADTAVALYKWNVENLRLASYVT